eukprot:scaffold72490_cov26-Tisochrysis_lutea.AAC.5
MKKTRSNRQALSLSQPIIPQRHPAHAGIRRRYNRYVGSRGDMDGAVNLYQPLLYTWGVGRDEEGPGDAERRARGSRVRIGGRVGRSGAQHIKGHSSTQEDHKAGVTGVGHRDGRRGGKAGSERKIGRVGEGGAGTRKEINGVGW